ncbi:MAG: hypothetical protein EA376_11100 [Phycisphaeraceae bacterium]|nr:MAG: hypothetical protein EA376_11100 [Phycisphaeraceae bacterium]
MAAGQPPHRNDPQVVRLRGSLADDTDGPRQFRTLCEGRQTTTNRMDAIFNTIPLLTLAQETGSDSRFLPDLLLGGGVLLLCVWALTSLRKKMVDRAQRSQRTPGERIESVRRRATSNAHIESVMADAEELTRRLAAHLDNKAARLEKLIAEADDRLARLEEASGPSGAARPNPRRRSINGGAHEEGHRATTLLHEGADPLTRRVHELADEGLGTVEIAQRLEEQVGKVELILALRQP